MINFKEKLFIKKTRKERELRLKKEAEEFQCLMDELNKTTGIKSIEEIERRTFYDVTFKVKLQDDTEVKVTLDEMRSMTDFITMIKDLDKVTVESLRSLDERHTIYYD